MAKKHDCAFRYTKKDIRNAANTEPEYLHASEERARAAKLFYYFVNNLGDNVVSDKIRCSLNLYDWEAYKINDRLQIQRFDDNKWIILNQRTGNEYYYDRDLRGYIEIVRLDAAPSDYIFYPDDYDMPLLSNCCFNVFKVLARPSELPKNWMHLSSSLPEYKEVVKACFIPLAVLIRIKKKAKRHAFIWEYHIDARHLCGVKYISSYYVFRADALPKMHIDFIAQYPKFIKLPNIYKIELPIIRVEF